VTRYGPDLLERIGRARLTGTPTHETIAVGDGLVLVACLDQVGCRAQLRALNRHLWGRD
jgi:hypothetical protein